MFRPSCVIIKDFDTKGQLEAPEGHRRYHVKMKYLNQDKI
jgi:hypothetical protein